ncbi:MAG: thioredoxin family protein [Bacteroidaceae bacterium]|nr:thioredoxin family protein [Bacteroidaceae bacterium]MBR4515853.1 thioredoxin family protein [Bacteroidaceae bacterium]
MKRISSLLTLYIFIYTVALAQFQNPVAFSVTQKQTGDNVLEVVFQGTIDAGWHVYGTDIADGGPTRAELTLEKQKGLKPDGKLRAAGKVQKKMDEMFGMEVSYMEGTASFVQRFTITEPEYEVAGYLTYGACNDENCIPPTNVEFGFKGTASPKSSPEGKDLQKAEPSEPSQSSDISEDSESSESSENSDRMAQDSVSSLPLGAEEEAWSPVVSELKAFEEGNSSLPAREGWVGSFLLGLLGGLIALLTPCVWPIIPMTVSFFLKRAEDKRKGIRDAITYGISIVVIYVLLGLLVTLIFGASALNALSTNAVFNIFFCLMLLVFGASFLGGFEITLPSSWTNAVDKKSGSTTGLLSIFLMAFTLSLVSFSCTGPIIGFLLVEVGTSGSLLAPTIGMLGFALALALPFTLFAMFPAWLKQMPKSGNWMNCIKVCLGLLEIAFALKFFSVADLAYGWHLMDREVFLSLWIVIFALMGAYLIGWIRFPHDEDEYDEMGEVIQRPRTSVTRFFMALAAFAFALYMVPGLWGAPCKAVSAFSPPMSTQDFRLGDASVEARFNDYDEGMRYAKAHNMPVMLDFTGYGCVNCRKMEAAVWTDPQVAQLMKEEYVLITLYVDEKTPLAEKLMVQENGQSVTLRTVGDRWSYLQRSKFGANAQPFYVLLDNEGHPLTASYSYNEDVPAYVAFLEEGLRQYNRKE